MKKNTAFQRALLESVQEEYDDIAVARPKNKRKKFFRWGLIAAAAVVILTMGVLAYSAGKLQVERGTIALSDDKVNQRFSLSFSEPIADEDAPEWIETYYAPAILDDSRLVLNQCFFQNGVSFVSLKETDTPEGDWNYFHLQWDMGDDWAGISQNTARSIVPNEPFFSVQTGSSTLKDVDTYTISYNGFEISCIDMTFRDEAQTVVVKYWIWTDGDYLFTLTSNMSEKYMKEMMDSLAPITSFAVTPADR